MSKKNYDNHNRWRNKTVAFRVSAEEDLQLETLVKLTGLTKQDYIIRRLLERDVVVQGNPKVYKALRDQLSAVLDELLADGVGMLAALLAAGNLSFWLCDRALAALTRYYHVILKPKLKKKF